MNPITLDVNKTTTFLLPILFPNSTNDEIFSSYFKQAYIGLLDDEMPDSSIILEFDEDSVTPDLIEDFINNLQPEARVVDNITNLIFLEFEQTHQHDIYELFLHGKYSKFDEDTKNIILNFWKEDENSLLYGILYNESEIVNEYTPYLNKDIIEELKETSGESWPPPNLFIDEFLVA